jgi:PBSX family phage terminase large subunit
MVGVNVGSIIETDDVLHKFLYTRYTMKAAAQSVIPEFLGKIDIMGYAGDYTSVGDDMINKNGSSILFRGIKTSSGNQTANLKSIPELTDWIIDEAEEMVSEDDFDTINYSIRQKGVHNRLVLVLNPTDVDHWIYQKYFKGRGPIVDGVPTDIPPEFNGIIDNVCYIHTTYLENIDNLDEEFIKDAKALKKRDLARYNHIFRGHFKKDLDGALWTGKMIRDAKAKHIDDEDLVSIVVAVDPSVSSSGEQDDAGIVVVGKTADGDYKVLDDASGQFTPSQWGNATAVMYAKHGASWVVAEVNQGGDLVVSNLRSCASTNKAFNAMGLDPNALPVKMVRATKGKLLRAEPIATLYELGKVSHTPGLADLEYELTTYTGEGQKSPGRLDALVWGITFLMTKRKSHVLTV